MSPVDLTLFAHVVSAPEPDLDLALAALLVAAPEHPGLDTSAELARLDALASRTREALGRLGEGAENGDKAREVIAFLFGPAGFRGDTESYYDPRNSFLPDVLRRRRGIPISLALVVLEVCRRLGVLAEGVGFPGHFLVRAPERARRGKAGGAYLYFDPFAGRPLSQEDLRELAGRVSSSPRDPDPRWLEPVTKKQMLARMLANLVGIYKDRRDVPRLRAALERLQVLSPRPEVRGELDALGGSSPWPSGGHALN